MHTEACIDIGIYWCYALYLFYQSLILLNWHLMYLAFILFFYHCFKLFFFFTGCVN